MRCSIYLNQKFFPHDFTAVNSLGLHLSEGYQPYRLLMALLMVILETFLIIGAPSPM